MGKSAGSRLEILLRKVSKHCILGLDFFNIMLLERFCLVNKKWLVLLIRKKEVRNSCKIFLINSILVISELKFCMNILLQYRYSIVTKILIKATDHRVLIATKNSFFFFIKML